MPLLKLLMRNITFKLLVVNFDESSNVFTIMVTLSILITMTLQKVFLIVLDDQHIVKIWLVDMKIIF